MKAKQLHNAKSYQKCWSNSYHILSKLLINVLATKLTRSLSNALWWFAVECIEFYIYFGNLKSKLYNFVVIPIYTKLNFKVK